MKKLSLLLVTAGATLLSLSSEAAVFTVNSLADVSDNTPGDGICLSQPFGVPPSLKCTLRAAIQETNALRSDDTITFSVTGSVELQTSLPIITDNLTITGPGASDLTIDANGTGTVLRFDSPDSNQIFSVSGVTIRGGALTGTSDGAGINIARGDTLTVTESTVTDNQCESEGAGIANSGTTNVIRSFVTNNTSGLLGGGIMNNGTMLIYSSTIDGNKAIQAGNSLTTGGGIATAGGAGGGGGESPVLTINNSKIINNEADSGGGISNLDGEIFLNGSIVSDNKATDNEAGGILNNETMSIVNSTLSGNEAISNGGGLRNRGALNLRNVTVTNNTAGSSGAGGGLLSSGTVTAMNSIIAENINGGVNQKDCSGAITSLGFNLIGDNTGCAITAQTGGLIGTSGTPIDPDLGILASNGGTTQTHALLNGSPAIDAGDPTSCKDVDGTLLTSDQRGAARVQDGDANGIATCDMGAFEANSLCGNGALDGVEQCDDGNIVDADGCDSNCTLLKCGNGITAEDENGVLEECDDGNNTNDDGCDAQCQVEELIDPAANDDADGGGGCQLIRHHPTSIP